MISQHLNEPYKLIVDGDLGYLSLVAVSPADIEKGVAPVPCHPGEIIDFVLEQDLKSASDLLTEYDAVMAPYRSKTPVAGYTEADNASPYYHPEFYTVAQKWLTDKGFTFAVFRQPAPEIIAPVNVHIDNNKRPVAGQCKYLVTFGDVCLYQRMHGNLPNGKPHDQFNLAGLEAAGLLPPSHNGAPHKTAVLGVQCARMYLRTIQNLVAGREPDSLRFHD